jgi:thioredoxin-like negative regulator of GroEL
MLDRILIACALALFGIGSYVVLRGWHFWRASSLAPHTGRPTLLYFRSDSCSPCVAQGHFVQQLQTQFAERMVVEKIDADVDQEKAARFGIFTLPTTLIIDEAGVVRHVNYGLADARKLTQQLLSLQEQGSAQGEIRT